MTNRKSGLVRVRRLFVLLCGPLAFATNTAAQSATASPAVDAATRRLMVDSIARSLERLYPSADTGRIIGDRLRTREREGAYASITSAAELMKVWTDDLQSVNGDKHLSVSSNSGPPMRPPADGERDQARESNFGFEEVRVLDGNVGYLNLSILAADPRAYETAVSALRFLASTDAVIVDVRGVPGGSGQMGTFLASHFLAPDIHLMTRINRAAGATDEVYTLADVPGPRRTSVPLYVLTDGKSASAAEHFPFVLQGQRRATIVGERTAGAGRNNTFVPLGPGMNLSISFTRVFDPRTGRGWEVTGVQPDIAAPSAEALQVAHAEARKAAEQYRRSATSRATPVQPPAGARVMPGGAQQTR